MSRDASPALDGLDHEHGLREGVAAARAEEAGGDGDGERVHEEEGGKAAEQDPPKRLNRFNILETENGAGNDAEPVKEGQEFGGGEGCGNAEERVVGSSGEG